jgi:hypothetical protein
MQLSLLLCVSVWGLMIIEAIVESGGWSDWVTVGIDWAKAVWPYLWASLAWVVLMAAVFFWTHRCIRTGDPWWNCVFFWGGLSTN